MSKAPTFQKPDPQDIVGVGRGVTWPIGLGGVKRVSALRK